MNIGIGIGLNLTRKEIVDAPMKYVKASIAKPIIPANVKLVRMINFVTELVAVNVLIMCNDIVSYFVKRLQFGKDLISDSGKRLISTLKSLGLCQLIKEPMKVAAQVVTLLDFIATSL